MSGTPKCVHCGRRADDCNCPPNEFAITQVLSGMTMIRDESLPERTIRASPDVFAVIATRVPRRFQPGAVDETVREAAKQVDRMEKEQRKERDDGVPRSDDPDPA